MSGSLTCRNPARRRFILSGLALAGSVRQQAAPVRLPISTVDHLSLGVANVRRSVDFYMRLFGTELARDPSRKANPGSAFGELFFVRLGISHLSISPLSPGQRPGIDHFCFAVVGFDRANVARSVTGFRQPWPDWPSGLWLSDPDGHIIQLAASTSAPPLPAIVRDAELVPPPTAQGWQPAFSPRMISRLELPVRDVSAAVAYYERLLGSAARRTQPDRFHLNGCDVVLSTARGERFRVAIRPFEIAVVTRRLRDLEIPHDVSRDGALVTLHDPDGLAVEIAAFDERDIA